MLMSISVHNNGDTVSMLHAEAAMTPTTFGTDRLMGLFFRIIGIDKQFVVGLTPSDCKDLVAGVLLNGVLTKSEIRQLIASLAVLNGDL